MIKILKHLIIHCYEKIKFKGKCLFYFSSIISKDAKFEGANKIYPRTCFMGSMGYGSYIGPNCVVNAYIGRFTSIAPFVRVNEGVHPFKPPFATTSPMFYSTRKQTGQTFAKRMLFEESKEFPYIGNDCWIGENCFISGSIKIGDGSVILAGAVVVSDVPPYSIVGGVPGKIISYRYDEATISFLLKIKWWNQDIDWLREHWELLCDIDNLRKYYNEIDS